MILMHFFPELLISLCLLGSLILLSLRVLSQGQLPVAVSAVSLAGLVYFGSRADLEFFESVIPMLRSDSLSYFGRLLSLLMVSVFAPGAYFHPGLRVRDKHQATLFLLFLSLFTNALFLSQSLVLFLGAAVGIHYCALHLIRIESGGASAWTRVFRVKSVTTGVWLCLGLVAFLVSAHLFGGVFFDSWIEGIRSGQGDWSRVVFLGLLILMGMLPLVGMRSIGKAPYSLGIFSFGTFLILGVFWFRIGVPSLQASEALPVPTARWMLSLLFGAIALRSVVSAFRTRDPDSWISAVFPVLVGLGLFTVLLPSDQSLPAFQRVALAALLTISLVSRVFLDPGFRLKWMAVFSLFAVFGAPPLFLGEQWFKMTRELIRAGDVIPGIMAMVLWFGLAVATIQIIGKVLQGRISKDQIRKPDSGELFFLIVYLLGTAALMLFQGPLISLLNQHPLANLW